MKSYNYHFMDKDYRLGFFYDRYVSTGNLYVGLINLGNEDDPYFGDLTVNLTGLLPFYAAIDDELDRTMCDWLERIGAGRNCNRKIQSNYGEYPLFEFDSEFLRDANSESFKHLLTATIGSFVRNSQE